MRVFFLVVALSSRQLESKPPSWRTQNVNTLLPRHFLIISGYKKTNEFFLEPFRFFFCYSKHLICSGRFVSGAAERTIFIILELVLLSMCFYFTIFCSLHFRPVLHFRMHNA